MKNFSGRKININGFNKGNLDQAKSRLILLAIFFIVAYVVVIAKVADLSLIQGVLKKENGFSEYKQETSQNKTVSDQMRADIVDRNGVIVARSIKTSSLYADAALILEPEKVAKDLKKIFPDLSYGATLQKLQSKKRFVWLKRNLTPEQEQQILYLGYPGLDFRQEMKRVYPQGSLISHVLGATGIDGQGLAGVEGSFNGMLAEGKKPLELTIDVRLQHILKREISNTIKEFHAKGGAGMIMDVETGEIIGAVSLPDYNPLDYAESTSDEKFNRFSLGVYELGSTFKVFSTAAYLEKTNFSLSKKYDVSQPIKIGSFSVKDYHPEEHPLTVPEIFMHSSNIGTVKMAMEFGTQGLQEFYSDIGLLKKPEFEIAEVGKPLSPNSWQNTSALTTSYGHGVAVSPLQLVTAASSIVNGGILIKPSLIKNPMKKKNNRSAVRIVSPETSHRMRQLMRLVVTEGTGSKAEVAGYVVGGKTGTADKPSKSGGYNKNDRISSFVGIFPMNKPRYAIYVMVDEPQGIKASYGFATGGWVGAPTVQKIISSMISVLDIPPSSEQERFEGSILQYVETKQQIKEEQEIAAR